MSKRHLPTRDGVSPSFAWLPHGSWPTLGAYLAHRFPMVDEDSWRVRMARGDVVDERGQAVGYDDAFRGGACISITASARARRRFRSTKRSCS